MTDFLLLAFIFLVAGVVSVPIASRLGLGSVLGYLIAGIVISPLLALLNVDVLSIQHFAEFGVVMMLFLVGLELEPKVIWSMRSRLLGLGGGQVTLTTLAVTGIAMAFGQPWTVALAIGMVLALSSTAIVLQTLNEKGLMRSDGGQSSFSVLLTQDIAVIPMLALLPLLAMPVTADLAGQPEAAPIVEQAGDTAHAETAPADHGTDGHTTDDHAADTHAADSHGDHGDHGDGHGSGLSLVDGLNGWQTMIVTSGAIAAVVFVGSNLTGPIFRFISNARLRELFVAAALMIVIGIALLMSLVGLSPALGTFIAGVVLANSEYRHELEADIDPFRGLLLGLFFMTVGAGIDFGLLGQNVLIVIALTIGLIALKAGILWLMAIAFRLRGADRWLFALCLAQAGEFGFVLLSFTVANAVIPGPIADLLLLVVALSMLLTPLLFIAYDRVIAPRYAADQDREADEIDEKGSVIIAGHGRFGGIVNRMLLNAGYTTTVIDFSSAQLEMLRAFGVRAFFGDATRPDVLNAAGIGEARMLVVAIDDKAQITELVHYAVKNYPDVHVLARATDRHHVYELYAAGCRDIIRETFDSSVRAGRSAFEALGVPTEEAQRMADGFVADDRTLFLTLAELYDPDVPNPENKAYLERAAEMRKIQEELTAEGPQGMGSLRARIEAAGHDVDAAVQRAQERREARERAK